MGTKILGIDPGTATVGFGVIMVNGKESYHVEEMGWILTDKTAPQGKRLIRIHNEIGKLISKHKPDVMAIERLFFANNAKTAMAVAQAFGAILMAATRKSLPSFEYTPPQVKLAIAGKGNADKKLVMQEVRKLLKVRSPKKKRTNFNDVADALAIAICHARSPRF